MSTLSFSSAVFNFGNGEAECLFPMLPWLTDFQTEGEIK